MADIQEVLDATLRTNELLQDLINGGGNTSNNFSPRNRGGYNSYNDNYRDIRFNKPENPKNIEELISLYKQQDELEVNRYNRMREHYESAKQYLEDHKEDLEEISELIENGIELTEEQRVKYSECAKAAQEYARCSSYFDNHTKFGAITKSIGDIGKSIKSMYGEVNKLTNPWEKVDAAASKYARTIGMTKEGFKNLGKDTNDNVVSGQLARKYNISTEELIEAQSNYIKAAGRNIRVDKSGQEDIAAINAVVGSKGLDLAGMLDNFGVGVSETAEKLGKMYADASKEGLSFEKYSDNVAKNIKLAQNYTFKNGIKGLESMAKKATALKIDMQQVASFADKVSTVEGAMDSAAKLQVLGGPFAQMADPLGMLNEGLTDMEGLQDRLAKMIGGLGTFDKETGEVRVSAFNKQRIKAAADAMGVSYDSLMESTNAQARRGEISKQLETSDNAKNFSDDMKELIKNSGTFKDGKAGVSIRGQFKSLDELNDKEDYEALKAETQTESEDIKDIAVNTRSIKDIKEGIEKQYTAKQAQFYRGLAEKLGIITDKLGSIQLIYTVLVAMQGLMAAGSIMDMGKGLFSRGKSLFSNGRGKGLGRLFRRKATGVANRISSFAPKTSNFITRGVSTVWNGAKSLWSSAGNAVTSATSSVVKGGIAQTGKRALIKTIGKTATTKALGVGAKLATGVAKGGPLGIVGTIGNAVTDGLVASGKMKKGGVGHHIGKGLSGAATGAAIGMFLGPLGALAGGIIGGAAGLFKAGKAKQERKLEENLKDTGITVKGKYNRRKLKKINKALETGEISERMRRKLKKQGDHELLAKIDGVAYKKSIKKKKDYSGLKGAAIGMALGGPIGALAGGLIGKSKAGKSIGNFIKNNKGLKGAGIGMALGGPFGALVGGLNGKSKAGKSIGNFIKNNKGLKGTAIGMALGGPIGVLIGGLIGKRKQESDKLKIDKKSNSDILNKFNSSVKPIPEKGVSNTYGGVDKGNKNIHIKTDPHDINLNGTLKLQGENGQTIDIVKELRNNPQMMRELTGMISNEMGVLEHGANISQR